MAPEASWDDVLARAKDKLMDVDDKDIEKNTTEAVQRLTSFKKSLSDRGDVVQDSDHRDVTTLILRAQTRICEPQLMLVFTDSKAMSSDAARSRVRPIIKRFRDQTQAKENACVHGALFKKAFDVISKRG